MNRLQEEILKLLKTEDYMTAAVLAEKIGVSERTVRTRIKECNVEIRVYGAEICARQNAGYYLQITDAEKYAQWKEKQLEKEERLPSTSEERIQYLLMYLLNREDYIKLDDICEFLFISRNTITADLKKVEVILNMYQITIDRRPNRGIRLVGKEFDFRMCIENCIANKGFSGEENRKKEKDMEELSEIAKRMLRQFSLKMSEHAFEHLVCQMYIMNGRIARFRHVEFTEEQREEIERDIGKYVQEAAAFLVKELEKEKEISCSKDEQLYLAIHLGGNTYLDVSNRYGSNFVISGKIDELVLKMLAVVYEVNGIDFRDNLELRMSLNQHMVPFDTRMKFNLYQDNPLLVYIKKEYSFGFTLAATACTVLNEYYGKEIPEGEIAYFAVFFAIALDKQDKKIDKKNIVIVCVSGRGSSQLFMHKYIQSFGKYIDQMYESTIYDIEEFDFSEKQIDYVFTTVPLTTSLPVPIFEISLFLSNAEVNTYKKLFEEGDYAFLSDYYFPELFIEQLSADTKEETLQKMCEYLKQYKEIPEDFYESVMQREAMGQTDFGNLIAIPHPYRVMTKERFVLTAVLDKPIWWGHNEVQVVCLMSLSEDNNPNVQKFYEVTTEFISDANAVKELLKSPHFETLKNILKKKISIE